MFYARGENSVFANNFNLQLCFASISRTSSGGGNAVFNSQNDLFSPADCIWLVKGAFYELF